LSVRKTFLILPFLKIYGEERGPNVQIQESF